MAAAKSKSDAVVAAELTVPKSGLAPKNRSSAGWRVEDIQC
jgi:hypothetical protein